MEVTGTFDLHNVRFTGKAAEVVTLFTVERGNFEILEIYFILLIKICSYKFI